MVSLKSRQFVLIFEQLGETGRNPQNQLDINFLKYTDYEQGILDKEPCSKVKFRPR